MITAGVIGYCVGIALATSFALMGIIGFVAPIATSYDGSLHYIWFVITFILSFIGFCSYFSLSARARTRLANQFKRLFKNVSHSNNSQSALKEDEQAEKLIKTFCQMAECIENRDNTLQIEKEHAEQLNQDKNDFLVSLSHELKTPLHGIINFADMGQSKTDDARLEKYFRTIENNGERLLNLINNLLELFKLEAKKIPFNFKENSISHIIRKAISMRESDLNTKNISIELQHGFKKDKAIFDNEKVTRVVDEILNNAIHHSPEEAHITVKTKESSIAIGYGKLISAVCVSISDQGKGIPQGELNMIFEKYKQSSATKPTSGGGGIGLAICNEIISCHHGLIWAENTAEGASFSFTLPVDYQANKDKMEESTS